MSDINIRIETQENEIERLINRIDVAIAKRDELLLGAPRVRALGRAPPTDETGATGVPVKDIFTADVDEMNFRISQLETRLQDAQNWLLQLLDKADIEAMLDPENIDANLDRWVGQF